MFIIRSVNKNDIDSIYELSSFAGSGLTTLPHKKEILEERIHEASMAFENEVHKPGGETYLFVLEDTNTNKIVGTSAIVSKVGGFMPFWTYEIKTQHIESKSLGVNKDIKFLQLKVEHNGPSEIGTLFLHPDYRSGNNGRLLSLHRFIFIAENRIAFEDEILAEMRGVIDGSGKTVFWEALGRHFFDVDFQYADYKVMQDKSFIDELMPKHPIYISLLPEAAQMVIAQVHTDTRPALRLLEQEGFQFNNEVDIFEAGPNMLAKTDNIRCLKESMVYHIQNTKNDKLLKSNGRQYMLCKCTSRKDYRALATEVEFINSDTIALTQETMDQLQLNPNDKVRLSQLRQKEKR